jgi:hypothetical protein
MEYRSSDHYDGEPSHIHIARPSRATAEPIEEDAVRPVLNVCERQGSFGDRANQLDR